MPPRDGGGAIKLRFPYAVNVHGIHPRHQFGGHGMSVCSGDLLAQADKRQQVLGHAVESVLAIFGIDPLHPVRWRAIGHHVHIVPQHRLCVAR